MLLKEIEDRYSVRSFSNQKICDGYIQEILEAGRLAPSWMNVQPWHFIITDKQEHKDFLSLCANSQKQIKECSHVIMVLGDLTAWNNTKFYEILKEKGMDSETIQHILNDKGYNPAKHGEQLLITRTMEQCSYAVSFMLLQAKSMGIDSCIIGAFANELTGFKPELLKDIREKFKIPNGMFIAGLLVLGYQKEGLPVPAKKRKSFEKVVSIEEYSE